MIYQFIVSSSQNNLNIKGTVFFTIPKHFVEKMSENKKVGVVPLKAELRGKKLTNLGTTFSYPVKWYVKPSGSLIGMWWLLPGQPQETVSSSQKEVKKKALQGYGSIDLRLYNF
jgi:hypothetical protein